MNWQTRNLIIEAALRELTFFRRSNEIDTNNAIAIADCLEDLIREIAAGDPEVADLFDRYTGNTNSLGMVDG